jgi:putative restriction endonuclease
VANGIALSKIHHAAFDNHLIGIDPDGRVHVSERLLMLHDGPLLEQSLKAAAGALIRLPRASGITRTVTGLRSGSSSLSVLPR